MSKYPPRIGRNIFSREALNAEGPAPQVLGTIADHITTPGPQGTSATWTGTSGTVSMDEPPAPWELEDHTMEASDARRFVSCPDEWVLRWKSPRFIESNGWEYWQAVSAEDTRVTVKVESMRIADGTVRRNGSNGDVLCWMHRSWVEKNRRLLKEKTDQLTQKAVNQQEQLRDDFARGKYGPYTHLDSAQHPTHTMGEGRTMKDA